MSDTPIPTRAVRTRGEPPVPPPSAQASASEAEAKLVSFVNGQIEKMQGYVQFTAGREPTFFEVNQALSNGKSAKDAVTDLLGREQKQEAN